MNDAINADIRSRLEERVRAVLLSHDGPMKRHVLQRTAKSRRWSAADFASVMADLEQRGVIRVLPDRTIELLDRREPLELAPAPRGRPRKDTRTDRDAWALRAATWDRTGGKCWYCGRQTNPFRDFQVDHMNSRSNGGVDDLENLVPCCTSCNFAKGSRTLDQFRALYQAGHRFFFEQSDDGGR